MATLSSPHCASSSSSFYSSSSSYSYSSSESRHGSFGMVKISSISKKPAQKKLVSTQQNRKNPNSNAVRMQDG